MSEPASPPDAVRRAQRIVFAMVVVAVVAALVVLGRRERARAGAGGPSGGAVVTLAVVVLAGVTVAAFRGVDVRLALFLGAIPLFLVEAGLPAMLKRTVAEMANAGTVVPICSAMGFAHVLRLTGCDQHLVRLLVRPLRGLRMLLVPGGVVAGYLINTTIVSQAATAAVLGPILVPLLAAGGLRPAMAGAVLLLGSSMGGELYNPGAVEIRKLAELTGQPGAQVVARTIPLNLTACSVALLAFWALSTRRAHRQATVPLPPAEALAEPSINGFKALVPLLPIVLLLADGLVGPNAITRPLEGPSKILAAMVIGIVAAGLADIRSVGRLAASFWEGAGQGYYHVISLIVAASTFAEGVQSTGLVGLATHSIAGAPAAAMVVAMVIPWALALVSGTGIAPAVAVMEFFIPEADSLGLDPMTLGSVAALGAHFGRTMSPAAAVVMMSARISGGGPRQILRLVAPALLIGGAGLLLRALMGAR